MVFSITSRIQIIRGDITTVDAGAIVTAANSALRGGGGVDGAVHDRAGPGLLRASLDLAPCQAGDARITDAFDLPARYVIHTRRIHAPRFWLSATNTSAAFFTLEGLLMSRALCFVYGLLAYVIGVPTLVYAVGFLIDQVVPKGINDGEVVPVSRALIVNVVLLLLVPVQHSIMARPSFKAKWTRIVPAAIERSTFVLVTGVLLWLLYWQWRPMPEVVWDIKTSSMRSLVMTFYFAGWVLLFGSSFLIDHFDLFGLRQVYFCLQGKEYTPPVFVERLVYRWIRHPLMLGFITAFWAAPTMTQGRLLFATVITAYIIVGIQMEERDLIANHGDDYKSYRQRTGMLLPIPRRNE